MRGGRHISAELPETTCTLRQKHYISADLYFDTVNSNTFTWKNSTCSIACNNIRYIHVSVCLLCTGLLPVIFVMLRSVREPFYSSETRQYCGVRDQVFKLFVSSMSLTLRLQICMQNKTDYHIRPNKCTVHITFSNILPPLLKTLYIQISWFHQKPSDHEGPYMFHPHNE